MKGDQIFKEAKQVLVETAGILSTLNYDEYTTPIKVLSDNSIGQHTRHIIELFQQLLKGYSADCINYDNRVRNQLLEENIDMALETLATLIQSLKKEDKSLALEGKILGKTSPIKTTYLRELLYNIEHCVHHQALIKVGLIALDVKIESDSFGVAKSTLEYRQKNV